MGGTTSSTRRAGAGAANMAQRSLVDLKAARGSQKASTVEAQQGTHVFEISGYSLYRERLGDHGSVSSAEFAVGGHDWQIRFHRELFKDYVAVVLQLRSKSRDAKVRASFRLSLVDVTGDLGNLGKLLQGKEGADVVLEVQGGAFPAHKLVLAMRSPVFKAQLYGAMREKDTGRITVTDMQLAVFEALLHFIYTDSLPAMVDLGRDDYTEILRHLLVAADRYAMERLKVMCESILCKNIDAKTVVTTLALADQHDCNRLNDACIQFIASLGTTELDDVIASQEYAGLKATSPLVLVELLEKTNRLGRSKSSVHIGSLVQTVRYIRM